MSDFQFLYPSSALAPFVKYYWALEAENVSQCVERILPIGCMQLMFQKKNRFFSTSANDFQPQSYIWGQSAGYVDLVSAGNIDMLVVVFHPHGIKSFFDLPMSEINEGTVSLDDFRR